MKLDKSCCFYNAKIGKQGNTVNWGTSLSKQSGDYSIEGEKKLFYEKIQDFYIDKEAGEALYAAAKTKPGPKVLGVAVLDNVQFGKVNATSPFIVAIIKEVEGTHVGRISLKINWDFEFESSNNQMVYNQIQNYFGKDACWFLDSIFFDGDGVVLSPTFVSKEPIIYPNADIKNMHWNGLTGDYALVKSRFSKFVIGARGLQVKTANEYLTKLTGPVFEWFLENNIIKDSFHILNIYNDIRGINEQLEGPLQKEWKAINKEVGSHYSAPWNRWCEFVASLNLDGLKTSKEYIQIVTDSSTKGVASIKETIFSPDIFCHFYRKAGLDFDIELISRFAASLQSKPFVILSGLTGSGKTKLAESFAMCIAENDDQWMFLAVGADWTNRDSLLGFENSLNQSYSLPPYNVPNFIQRAAKDLTKPYFLILDEMNLSVVERYFADFLSAIESSEKEISLHHLKGIESPPKSIKLPPNLFIIGTVNVDESTYMFSPKVLDRANTIEFRLSENDIKMFLGKELEALDMDKLKFKGKAMAASFLKECKRNIDADLHKKMNIRLMKSFPPLKSAGAEFGYRTIIEIRQLASQLDQFDLKGSDSRADKALKEDIIFDIAILQKLLPKLHGSVGKLKIPLTTLAELCFDDGKWDIHYLNADNDAGGTSEDLRYPLSFEKIKSMYLRLMQNGFVSFAEA